MSDYPRLPILRESTCDVQSGHEPVRATNGALHVRRSYSAKNCCRFIEGFFIL